MNNLADELDAEIISWALQMVRENRVDFHNWEYDLDYWFSHIVFRNELGECAISLMRCHVASLGSGIAAMDLYHYEDFVRDYFGYERRRNKCNRCGMVMYGLWLYAIRRTHYQYQPSDADNGHLIDNILCDSMDKFHTFLEALARGWDFQTDADGTDYPLEFYIESAKAFVQES